MPPDSIAGGGFAYWDWIGRVGSVASFFGLLLTIAVYVGVREIRQRYLLRARLPELVEQLSELTSKIQGLLRDHPATERELDATIAKCDGVLNNVEEKVEDDLEDAVNAIRSRIEDLRGDDNPVDGVWALYSELNKLLTELRAYLRDLKWER